jgi:broad specificity phosphatase PhoE
MRIIRQTLRSPISFFLVSRIATLKCTQLNRPFVVSYQPFGGAASSSVSLRRMSSLQMEDSAATSFLKKEIWIVRHGQAMHNPRAEHSREVLQCSHEEFLRLMQQDDCLDAPLTELGIQQAQQVFAEESSLQPPAVELVVASPLSRALHTADLAFGADKDDTATNRVCYEGFREINGWLRNAQRRSKSELQKIFPAWDFSHLSTEEDALWTPELETPEACRERGYQGLRWIMKHRVEQSALLVSHGALLKYTLTEHPNVVLRDGRQPSNGASEPLRCIRQRYHNGEVRRYHMELVNSSEKANTYRNPESRSQTEEDNGDSNLCDIIVLTELEQK